MERQLSLEDIPTRRVRRRSNSRRTIKRLTPDVRPRVLNYWITQHMMRPFLQNAETWKWDVGSEIADSSGHDVESGSAFRDNLTASGDLDSAIELARKLKLPAKDVIDALYNQTKQMAYRINDQTGWTATYFGYVVDHVIERYPRSKKYGEELKRKALNKPLPV